MLRAWSGGLGVGGRVGFSSTCLTTRGDGLKKNWRKKDKEEEEGIGRGGRLGRGMWRRGGDIANR